MTPNLSVIIITKNEADMIGDCVKSVQFADEIIVVDTGNTDKTNQIARQLGATIVPGPGKGYAEFRNQGLSHARGKWILFVDADERVSASLAQELLQVTRQSSQFGAYELPRHNNYLGVFMNYGGWGGESLVRLFQKQSLKRYVGDLHEQPEYSGKLGRLTGYLTHYSHRDLSSMLTKTLSFTAFEAQARFMANHPPIVPWRILRVMATEFWFRFIRLQAWRDGVPGVIDGMFQVFNSFVIYARLWELQHENRHRLIS